MYIYSAPDFFSSLMGTCINSGVLILGRIKTTAKAPSSLRLRAENIPKQLRRLYAWVAGDSFAGEEKYRNYATVFAAFVTLNVVIPFLFWEKTGEDLMSTFCFSAGPVSALLAFSLLFRDWKPAIQKYEKLIWSANLFLFFAVQLYFTLAHSLSNKVWLLSFVLFIGMLFMLANETKSYLIVIVILSVLGTFLFDQDGLPWVSGEHAVWVVGFHSLSVFASVVIFRKIDGKIAEQMKVYSGQMNHAHNEGLGALQMEAQAVQETVDELVENHQLAKAHNLPVRKIDDDRLTFLKQLPEHIKRNTDSMRANSRMLLVKMGKINNRGEAPKLCHVSSCLEAALHDFSLVAPEAFRSIEWINKGNFVFWGYEHTFVCALSDILKNAREAIASSKKGIIRIRVLESLRELHIEDTACGISPEHQRKLFVESFTTKQRGTGLGLPYCKTVMEDIGGDIECVSEEGAFTCFKLTFPRLLNGDGDPK